MYGGIVQFPTGERDLWAAYQCLTVVLGRGQSGRGVKLTTPSSNEVENEWSCTFAPEFVFMTFAGATSLHCTLLPPGQCVNI
jgi:hypothetical protein